MMDGGDAESFRPHFICCQVKRRWRPMERDKDAWTVLGRLLLWTMNRELGEGDKCVPLDILSHARARRRTRRCYYADKMLTCGSGFSGRSNSFSSTLCDISGNQRRSRSASRRPGARVGGADGQPGGWVGGVGGGNHSNKVATWCHRLKSLLQCVWLRLTNWHLFTSAALTVHFLDTRKTFRSLFFFLCVPRVSATLESHCQQIQGARDTSGTCSRQLEGAFSSREGLKQAVMWCFGIIKWDYGSAGSTLKVIDITVRVTRTWKYYGIMVRKNRNNTGASNDFSQKRSKTLR